MSVKTRRGKIIVTTNDKGGTGKTTISLILAQTASKAGLIVAGCDFDTQKDFLRGMQNAGILIFDDVQTLEKDRTNFDIAIIDTPPGYSKQKEAAIEIADLILIPISHAFPALNSAVYLIQRCPPNKAAVVLNLPNPELSLEKKIIQTANKLCNVVGSVQQYARIRNNLTMQNEWNSGLKEEEEKPYLDLMKEIIKRLNSG